MEKQEAINEAIEVLAYQIVKLNRMKPVETMNILTTADHIREAGEKLSACISEAEKVKLTGRY